MRAGLCLCRAQIAAPVVVGKLVEVGRAPAAELGRRVVEPGVGKPAVRVAAEVLDTLLEEPVLDMRAVDGRRVCTRLTKSGLPIRLTSELKDVGPL